MIEGGYYIKARKIQESIIAHSPPHVREIWDWLLREANHNGKKYSGFTIERGQLFRTYKEIQDGLAWFVGWRKETYNENHVKKAMKFLRSERMVTTQKELGGVLITICNYDYYQNPKNYEGTKDGTKERTIEEPSLNQPLPDNNKNGKNDKELKNDKKVICVNPSFEEIENYGKEKGYNLPVHKIINHYTNGGELNYWIDAKDKKVKRWKSKVSSVWFEDEYKIKKSTVEIN